MRREKHYIAIYAGKGQRTFQLVDGYTETIGGIMLGFRKNVHGCWVVTDIFTGMAIGITGSTRKEAVERAKGCVEKLKEYRLAGKFHDAEQQLEKFKLGMEA